MLNLELFLKNLPADQSFLVLHDGKALHKRLPADAWHYNETEQNLTSIATQNHLICLYTGENRFSLTVAPGKKLHLTEWFTKASTLTIDYVLETQSQMEHTLLDSSPAHIQQLKKSTVTLAQDAALKSSLVLQGSATHQYEHTVLLSAPGASFHAKTSLLLPRSTQLSVKTDVQHQSPHTTSEQSFRVIVQALAKSAVTGHILVAPKALDTVAHLDHKALLLEERATASVQPNLEIYADAIQCSHGASISQIEAESLFFLQSRGLDHTEATYLLLDGFLAQTLPILSDPTLSAQLKQQVQNFLGTPDVGR